MRVVEVNSVCNKGSTGRIAAQLALLLREKGEEAIVAYGRDDTNFPYAFRIGGKISTWIHGLITRTADAHCYGSAVATWRFVGFLKKYKPDVVHLHNIHGYYLNDKILFSYLRKANIPVIWTLHDCWPFTGHCAHFQLNGCTKWKTSCNRCPLKKCYPTSFGFDGSARNFVRKKALYTGLENMSIVVPSYWLSNLVKESFLKKYPIHVIHNGIDLSFFKPCDCSKLKMQYRLTHKKVVLGVAGSWDISKGLNDFKSLSKLLPDPYKVVLVGCDPAIVEDEPKIMAVPKTDSIQELAAFYSMAEVFVNLTYNDSFPTVNLEALACGTPVITYRTGGSPETIDETCGIVVEQGDLFEVVQGIYKLDKEPIDRHQCIARSKKFDHKKRFMLYVDMIQKVAVSS